ncbi:hypothetical protein ACIHFE_24095 [Streptomyces sp. NPDC052396]|uniref:hypothetical protein n=1 Tax=Streptomyces sp. NPDC052396 TaxID=3365689 RepID=UPI0037D4B311
MAESGPARCRQRDGLADGLGDLMLRLPHQMDTAVAFGEATVALSGQLTGPGPRIERHRDDRDEGACPGPGTG